MKLDDYEKNNLHHGQNYITVYIHRILKNVEYVWSKKL